MGKVPEQTYNDLHYKCALFQYNLWQKINSSTVCVIVRFGKQFWESCALGFPSQHNSIFKTQQWEIWKSTFNMKSFIIFVHFELTPSFVPKLPLCFSSSTFSTSSQPQYHPFSFGSFSHLSSLLKTQNLSF